MEYDKLDCKKKASIDLHGLTVYEAEMALTEFLNHQPKGVMAVEVTHGYSRGTALKKMVKQEFHHWKIKEKRVGLNPGVTYFYLK